MSAAREHLAALALEPRPAGSEAERRAREYCLGVLRAQGCDIVEHVFEYSTFAGKWGTPLFGVAIMVLMLATAIAGVAEKGTLPLAILIVGTTALGGAAWWLGRHGVLDVGMLRAHGTNVVAQRGTPTLWLVAHLDSKSQPIPIGVRAIAITASIALLVAGFVLALVQLVAQAPAVAWQVLAVLETLAALPVIASVVGARSPGALDDASGVATVLRAVELLPRDAAIGVLLTSAEELGLAGARAWARESAASRAINIDGVDDDGGVRLIYSGRAPNALLTRLGRGWPTATRLMPGLLMDGVALADAGWEVVNVSKGSWRTVSRIHTSRDDLSRLAGRGVEEVATLLAASLARPDVGIDPSRH